jgi:hypothetical protein
MITQATLADVLPHLQIGDAMFFTSGGFLSWAIRTVTRSNFSHMASVYSTMQLIESTETGTFTGVQLSDLVGRVQDHVVGGGLCVVALLKPEVRARGNWDAWHALAETLLGKPYDYRQMLRMIFEPLVKLPIVGEDFMNHEQTNDEYCSELATLLNKAAGVVSLGVDAAETSPEDASRFNIYQPPIQICGRPLSSLDHWGSVNVTT